METDTVSETLCFLVSNMTDDGKSKNPVILTHYPLQFDQWECNCFMHILDNDDEDETMVRIVDLIAIL
jgi:hypothetical protein